jgi:cysteine-rich repeat protein
MSSPRFVVAVVAALAGLFEGRALAQFIQGTADDTSGVYLFSAGGSAGTCQSPLGTPAAQQTDDIVLAALGFGLLEFAGDHGAEIDSFSWGADEGGTDTDKTLAEVVQGLTTIDDFGLIGAEQDDAANFDAGTGGQVTTGLRAISGVRDERIIRPDGVIAAGTLGPSGAANAAAADAALGGFEIFIFEDAELSGMTIRLTSPNNDITIQVADRQVDPHTEGGADDTLIAIDLDSLSGFDGTFIDTITVTDDGTVMSDSPCPRRGETSIEIDAIALRASATATRIDVTKTADPISVAAPGGPVTFTVRVDNSSTLDTVTIQTMTDSVHGNLNGQGSCTLPQAIPAGSFYQCAFSAVVSGEPGDAETNVVNVAGIDEGSDPVSGGDSATVIVTGVVVTKTALPATVVAPGETVTFGVRVDNPSAIGVGIATLGDDVHGNLNGRGSCSTPQAIPSGGFYSCSFSAFVGGAPGGSETDVVTASGTDDHGNAISGLDDAVVNIVAPTVTHTATSTPTATATPTATPTPEPFCGDGNVDAGEQCDDANPFGGDGCEADCTISTACSFSHGGAESFVGGCGAPSFATIQAAVDAAADGDIVSVCPGTYTQSVQITKQIHLRSTGGAPLTTIHTAATTLEVRRSGVRIEGFTLISDGATAVAADAICPLGQTSCGTPQGSNLTVIGNVIEQSVRGVGWVARVDCAQIRNNTMRDNDTHVGLGQVGGAVSILGLIEGNALGGGGQSGAAVTLASVQVVVAANEIQGSAGAAIVLEEVEAGTQVIENQIGGKQSPAEGNATYGIRVREGAQGTLIENNNIEGNGVAGLFNEASGTTDARLNWWGSQSGPSGVFGGVGDEIVNAGGGTTLFIEFLCKPFPQGFPSIEGICSIDTAEITQLMPGRSPDLDTKGRYIVFESSADLDVDERTTYDNADGGQEIFLLNRRPRKKLGGVCLGGVDPCDFIDVSSCSPCKKQRDCPGNPGADPVVLNGECVLVTQLSNHVGTVHAAVGPRTTRQGLKTFYSTTGNQTDTNPDGSSEVVRFDRRAFDKSRPGVYTALTDGAAGEDSEAAAPSITGRYIILESTGDPTGGNADGNREIFVFQPKKNEWTQVTDTLDPVENRRPETTGGRRFVFDSNGDLHDNPKVGGIDNADGNREVFVGKLKRGGVEITQITDSAAPVENVSGATDNRAKLIAFSSTGNYTTENADGNEEIFTWFKGTFEQITETLAGESRHPTVNTNGRFVVFETTADLLNNGATNRRIFQFDRVKGLLLQVSRSRFGENQEPRTRKRRYVVWESTANLTGQNPFRCHGGDEDGELCSTDVDCTGGGNCEGESVIYLFDRKKDE